MESKENKRPLEVDSQNESLVNKRTKIDPSPSSEEQFDQASASDKQSASDLNEEKLEFNVLDLITEVTWKNILKGEYTAKYIKQLSAFLKQEFLNYVIYPPQDQIFASINHSPFNQVKVVILGQDPYPSPRQANGMCFSVNDGISAPPSLQNIFTELKNDLGVKTNSNNLLSWSKQGVLLLNTVLTVRKGEILSHGSKGWEYLTTRIIQHLNIKSKFVVFLLWGKQAQEKKKLIDTRKHLVLEASHPSPKSADNGYKPFFGCKHFSQTNAALKKRGISPITLLEFKLSFEAVVMETVQCSSVVIVNPDHPNQVLCHQRPNGLWELPGGKAEKMEDIYACARRELLEETGLQVREFGDVVSRSTVTDEKNKKIWDCYYIKVISFYPDQPLHLEAEKGTAWEWVDFSELKTRNCIYSMRNLSTLVDDNKHV